jgi:hypothetical protein
VLVCYGLASILRQKAERWFAGALRAAVMLICSKPAENHLEQADLTAKNNRKALFTGVTSY